MRKLTILVDMDDTIECLLDAWVGYINDMYGTNVQKDEIKEWDMCKAFPTLAPEDIYGALRKTELWQRVKPMPNAVEYLQRLINDGHNVFIVTASHYESVPIKIREVIEKYFSFIKWEDIIITQHKQLVRGDVLIDDAPHNLIGGSYKGILFTAPHNRSFDESTYGLLRADDWCEVYQYIQDICKEEFNGRN